MNVSNCQHFTERHPTIEEGGCSSRQVKTVRMAGEEKDVPKVKSGKSFFQKIIEFFRRLFN